jgi:hypothetical protein
VGAYPLLPKTEDRARAYHELVAHAASEPEFCGLEVPFTGELDDDELSGLLGGGHELVITSIPGVVAKLSADPAFGLASHDEDGRMRAVRFTRAAHDGVRRLHDTLGRRATRAVLVHSASAPGQGSVAAFRRSLDELTAWGWDDALLLVEHCDAAVPGVTAAKGFLPLDDELSALEDSAAPRSGVLLNWGRSAIELRDPDAVADQVAHVRSRGLLRGLIFSGCSPDPASRGGAWADVHLPPSPIDERSALSRDRAIAAVRAAGGGAALDVLGMKVGAPPDADGPRRASILAESAALLLGAARA